MRVAGALVLTFLLGAGCAARSEIAGGSFGGADGSVDATSHGDAGGSGVDGAAPDGDGAADAAVACTPSSIKVGCGGLDCSSCKFDIEWTCGGAKYRVGGECTPPDAGPAGGFYEGVCDQNGAQSSTFQVSTKTCDCKDQAALVTLVEGFCTHQ
jgi:hypothetical protein